MTLRVLFVGGSGQISLPCVIQAVAAGHDVTIVNRGISDVDLPTSVSRKIGDMDDHQSYAAAVDGTYDVVCQFLVFEPAQAMRDIAQFTGKTKQYIFISSASAYRKPVTDFPITESVPLDNPYWHYSRQKAACEKLLLEQDRLPVTIVRPSHTIRTKFPTAFGEGDTAVSRMLRDLPIIVPGDGKALWTLTRAEDFAPPFVGLFGKSEAVGEAFHLTSDHAYPWDAIYQAIGRAVGARPDLVHVPTDNLVQFHPDWVGFLKGDKAYSVQFDNAKIKSVVGEFSCEHDLDTLLREPREHWLAKGGPEAARPSDDFDNLFDQIIALQRQVQI
ncbi:MAG: NAD(P)H-binding protein [Alphaproteobacteria bacterium]|nr:NAD(P)H-binding protein [Alphaproteobacteria bacterium]